MAKIYNAPKPSYSGWDWFKYIAVRTIFPPVLLWDLTKFGANKLLGAWVSDMVLPAQKENFDYLAITDDRVNNYNEKHLICEKHEVITHDKAHLDTFEIKHYSQTNIAPKYQKYIINFVGNGMCYEHIIDDMKEDAKTLQANVIGFNLRGVGKSKGKATSRNDLVVDGIAQIQRLLDEGVSPQNITLKGHSLGAGIASLVAKHFHQLDQPINLFNSRSFSTITNFLIGHMRLERNDNGEAIGHKDSLDGIILGWLAKPFVKFGVALAKWEIDAGSAFKSIPEAYKDYIVVRSRKEIRGDRIDDGVIPHYASIHAELTAERRTKKSKIDEKIERLDKIIRKADSLSKPELIKAREDLVQAREDLVQAREDLVQAREDLVQAREQIKSDRKMETDVPYENGHNSDWNSLHNRSGNSAQTFFREFIQRIDTDHAVKNALQIN